MDSEMENIRKPMECDARLIADYDISTGAYRCSLDDVETMYKELSREIFSRNRILRNTALAWSLTYYHTPTFEEILKKHFGEELVISLARDPTLPRVSAISTLVNQEPILAVPYIFRSYAFPPQVKAQYRGGRRHHVWEAVRASAAAPTYFGEFKVGKYFHLDGGISMNNPTSVAISEAKGLWPNDSIKCVVSLGTGLSMSSNTNKDLEELIEQGAQGEKYLSWKGKFFPVLYSATDTETVHNTLDMLLSPDIYFRINPCLSEVVKLDDTNPANLERVQMETRDHLERNIEKMQNVAKTLLKGKGYMKVVLDWRGAKMKNVNV